MFGIRSISSKKKFVKIDFRFYHCSVCINSKWMFDLLFGTTPSLRIYYYVYDKISVVPSISEVMHKYFSYRTYSVFYGTVKKQTPQLLLSINTYVFAYSSFCVFSIWFFNRNSASYSTGIKKKLKIIGFLTYEYACPPDIITDVLLVTYCAYSANDSQFVKILIIYHMFNQSV